MEKISEKVYSTKQVADLIGVHKNTLLNWIRSGKCPDVARNLKNYRIWTSEDVERAMHLKRKDKQLELEF